MKIAILADPLDNQRAGVHVYTKELIHALIRTGYAQHFVLIRERVDPELAIEQIAVPNVHLPIGFASLRLFFLVPYILRKHQVDAVFEPAHFGPFNLPRRIKRITMIHDLTPILFPQYHRWHSQLLQRIFLKGVLRRADLIITNSRYTQSDIERVYPFTKGKVEPIYLGKHESFQPTQNPRRVEALGIKRPYFIFVGTIEPRKNLNTLLDAFKTFCLSNKEADLVVVGQVGWKADSFEADYAVHPNKDRIHRLGFVDFADLPILYSHSLGLVYPSEYEGFGLPLVEAAACGTQLIVANNSSLAEVGEGVAHFFDTYDADDLAQQLMNAIENPVSETQLLEYAVQFSWKQCAEEFVQKVGKAVVTKSIISVFLKKQFKPMADAAAEARLQLKPQERTSTLREYVLWEAQQEEKYEFYDGIIRAMPYARGPHNEITINLVTALKLAVRELEKTYRIFSGDQKLYLPELNCGVYPDAVVVSESPQYWDDDTLLLTNPLLVVEVLSKSTQRYDRAGKFDLYKTRPSFQEYVLVRQDACEIETRFREEPNLWRETVVTDPKGEVVLKSLGCSIAVEDIYEHIVFPEK